MNDARINRRDLLKSAAVAVAAPYVITSTALGNADTPPASGRVTLGHIGFGVRGLPYDFLQCKGMQAVAIADPYRDRREAGARLIKGKAYADFRDLLARKDIDAVTIATPDHWHVPIAILAARAKKDVYGEKPLGLTIEQDLACLKVFQETGRVFQYGTQQRSMPNFRLGCELVRSGRIGKVHTIEVVAPDGSAGGSTQKIPVPPTLDYNMWLGPAPLAPYTADRCKNPGHFFIHDYSIGYLAGWGAHPLDIMIWGNDSDLSGPMTVEGTGTIPTEGLYNNVMNWDMRVQFGDGVKLTFKPGRDSTKFIGSEGWVRVWRDDNGIDAEPKSLLTSKIGPNDVHLIKTVSHAQDFIDAVKSRKPTVAPLDQAVRSDTISQLCDIAVRMKRRITWDPKAQKIVSMTEMRAPWTL
jgi:glucose-fructose oxidoreductase